MKNLNNTIKKATMPKLNLVTSVNRTFLYSLCAACFLLTCSLLSRATGAHLRYYKSNPYNLTSLGLGAIADFERSHRALLSGSNTGVDFADAKDMPHELGFETQYVTSIDTSAQTSGSPFTNNFGDSIHSGTNEFFHLSVKDAGYLSIIGGTSNFDSVFSLCTPSGVVLTSADDGTGSSLGSYGPLQPYINRYYVSAGDYVLVIDGTDKYGFATSGDMSWDVSLSH